MKTLKLAGILFVLLLFSKFAYAISANELSKFIPDKIGDFMATENATIQDTNKESGAFHRVQRTYSSDKGLMCIIALIEGPEVSNIIKDIFSREGKKTTIGNFEVIQLTLNKNDPMVKTSVKIGKQCLLTVLVLNTKDTNAPIEVFKKLNLDGLAKIIGENDN